MFCYKTLQSKNLTRLTFELLGSINSVCGKTGDT